MIYYQVTNGVVTATHTRPNTECPHSTDLPIECGMVVGNRTDAELAAAIEAQARARLIAEIEATTAALLATGAEYPPASGHWHALDPDRIPVYEGAKSNKNAIGSLKVISKGKRVVTLANAAAIEAMHAAMLTRYLTVTQSGASLIESAWLDGADLAAIRAANQSRL